MSLLRRKANDRSRTQRKRRGAALVEAAFVLPVCLLFLFGIMEYSRYLMMMHLTNNAAREGARYAVSHTQPVIIEGVTYGNSTSDVTDVVNKYMTNKKLVNQVISVYLSDSAGNNIGNWTSADAGQSICVQVTGKFQWFTPKLLKLPSQSDVRIRAVMRSESN